MIYVKMIVEIFKGWVSLLALISGAFYIRRARLTRGRHVRISPTAFFKHPDKITIGDNTFVNHLCSVWASPHGPITLGRNVVLGPNVSLISSNHGIAIGALIREQTWVDAPITIGDDVWLGANVVVTAGVSIGNGCVVGAGAIVTKDLPPMSISVGVPARVIAFRRADSQGGSQPESCLSRDLPSLNSLQEFHHPSEMASKRERTVVDIE